jgi:hypothetical protein
MTSVAGTASLAVVLAFAQVTQTPARPDFSGTWTLDRARSQSPEAITLEITQSDAEVRIESIRNGVSSPRVYPIEIEIKPAAGGGRAGTVAVTSARPRAFWDGVKLITEGTSTIQGQTVSIKETLSLNAAGTEMIVESLVIVQHGYSFGGTRNYGSAKDVYTRVKR